MNYVTQKNMKDILDGIKGKVPMGQFVSTQTASDSPLGTIIAYMGITPPDGFLACDGSTYNIADYTALATHIMNEFGSYNYFGGNGTTTFAVPDLRGEFLRGTGTNSHTDQGNGASVGVHQNATTMPHYGTYLDGTNPRHDERYNPVSNTPTIVKNPDAEMGTSSYANHRYYAIQNSFTYTGTSSVGRDSFSARPTNTSVLYCIKYTAGVSNQYSTTEQAVGTWIDGSTLYQITYTATSPSAINTSGDVVTLASNIHIKSIDAIMDTTSGTLLLLNHYVSATDFASVWRTSVTGNLRMSVGSTSYTSQPVYITIRYTKS